MKHLSLSEFSDRLHEIIPFIMREFLKSQGGEFYKMHITLPQFLVLDLLNRQGLLKMTAIANHLGVSTAAVTGIVDRLFRDKYVTRLNDPKDRRVIKIAVTKRGGRVVGEITRHRKEMILKVFGMVSQAEREAYLRVLTRIKDRLEDQKRSAL